MKIHIVQKGDTLWELAKKYNVDHEEIKQLNSQLSSPDMVMPGMKVKIPSSKKQVKETETANKKEVQKEVQKEQAEVPYKGLSAKPLPTIKEDDHSKPMEVKAEVPMQHMPMKPVMEMPVMEEEKPATAKKMPKETSKPMKKAPLKEEKKEHPMMELPMMNETTQMHSTPQQDQMKSKENQEWYPMIPVCCHCMHGHHPPMHQQIPCHHGPHINPKYMMPMAHQQHMFMPDQMGLPNQPMMGAQASPCGGHHRGSRGFEEQHQPVSPMQFIEPYDQHQMAMQQAHHARQATMYPPNYATPSFEHSYPNPPGYGHHQEYNNRGDQG